jgi:hypothetical protein
MMNGAHADRPTGNSSPPGANGQTDPREAAPPNRFAGTDAADATGNGSEHDLCEIEYDGRTYQVPTPLKGAFLRQQDYTRKTQDVARQRQALDQARAMLATQLTAQQQHVRDIAALVNLDEQLQALARINWPMLRQQNPQGAATAQQRLVQLTNARNQIAAGVQNKLRARALLAREIEAKKVADAQQQLRRDIKGWDAEMARRLRDYGISLGFNPDELAAVSDPRAIKALHRAYVGEQQLRQPSAPQSDNELRPLSQVARRSSPAEIELSDKMSTEDWIRARNRQVRQRKGY